MPGMQLNSCSDAVLFPLHLQPELDQAADHRITRLIFFHSWIFNEKLVSRFVQTPFGAAGICREVTDQFTREFVDVDTFEVVELLSLEIENGWAKDDRYVDAATVEYFSVHDQPAYRGAPRQRLRLLAGDSETNRNLPRCIQPGDCRGALQTVLPSADIVAAPIARSMTTATGALLRHFAIWRAKFAISSAWATLLEASSWNAPPATIACVSWN